MNILKFWRAAGCCLMLYTIGCQPAQDQETTLSPEKVDSIKRSYEAISLLGDTLYAPELPASVRERYDSALLVAEDNYRQRPTDLDNLLGWGHQLGELSRFREAIDVFTKGLRLFPESAELYQHRGHRYITIRQFDKAILDLEKSAELLSHRSVRLAPDGTPLPLSPDHPTPSLQFDVYYHLGLAYYLTEQYGKAAEAYETCLTFCDTDDQTVATADWLYMTYRRLGEDEVAERTLSAIREDMQVQESEGYLEHLLMYKGDIEPEALLASLDTLARASSVDRSQATATTYYGVGNFYLYEGDTLLGEEMFKDIVDGRHWAALEYIAAEADLARQR